MPIYLAHGGLTAISHDQTQYLVVDGVVELPDNSTWQLDLVACGALEPITSRPTVVVNATPEAEAPAQAEAPAPEPAVALTEPAPSAPVLEVEAPASVEALSLPVEAPARPAKRRGGRG